MKERTTEDRFAQVFMISIALTPLISVQTPRFLAFWPLIIGLFMSIWLVFIKREKLNISRTYFISAIVIGVLLISSSIWSIAPEKSLIDGIKATTILLLGGLFIAICKSIDIEKAKPYFLLFPISLIIAILFTIFDLYTDMALYRIIHQTPVTDKINTSVMNRSVLCMIFAFFISLIFIKNLNITTRYKIIILTALITSILTMMALSQSQSSQLAFAVGVLLLLAFPAHYKVSYYIIGILITTSLILTPWIAQTAFQVLIDNKEIAQSNSWLENAYIGNRLEIWNFVINYAMNNPLYGYGIESTNYVPAFEHDYIYQKKATVLHPHNFSVQIWMEFGVIGVTLAVVIMALMIRYISKIEDLTIKKIITTLFIIVILSASMTYGLWQGWWLGEFIFLMGLSVMVSNTKILNENISARKI